MQPGAARRELERIDAFYESHGYPDAEVVSYDIDMNEQANTVRVHVTVREGEPVVIESVSLVNFDALSESERAALRERLPVRPGEPLVEQELVSSAELAGEALRNHGYPWAKVEVERRVENRRAEVVLRAAPSQLAFFGPVEVVGNTTVSDAVIRRQLLIRPGDLYRLEAIRASLRRLSALELFDVASIELAGEPRDGLEYPVRVVVTEGDGRSGQPCARILPRRRNRAGRRLAARHLPLSEGDRRGQGVLHPVTRASASPRGCGTAGSIRLARCRTFRTSSASSWAAPRACAAGDGSRCPHYRPAACPSAGRRCSSRASR